MPPTTIRLDPDVKQAIEALSEADGRSVSGYINRVLRDHIEVANALKGKGGMAIRQKSKG